MATLTRKLEKLRDRKQGGKRAIVKVLGVPYAFDWVMFGGTSPSVALIGPDGERAVHTAAEWRRLGADL